MKKTMLALMVFVSTAAVAAEANLKVEGRNPPAEVMRSYTPLSITIITPVALPPGFWDVKGLQVGGFNWAENFDGCQIGFFNTTDVCRGWQIGGINYTRKMYGVQIGFVNIIEDNDIPFIPVINWYF